MTVVVRNMLLASSAATMTTLTLRGPATLSYTVTSATAGWLGGAANYYICVTDNVNRAGSGVRFVLLALTLPLPPAESPIPLAVRPLGIGAVSGTAPSGYYTYFSFNAVAAGRTATSPFAVKLTPTLAPGAVSMRVANADDWTPRGITLIRTLDVIGSGSTGLELISRNSILTPPLPWPTWVGYAWLTSINKAVTSSFAFTFTFKTESTSDFNSYK